MNHNNPDRKVKSAFAPMKARIHIPADSNVKLGSLVATKEPVERLPKGRPLDWDARVSVSIADTTASNCGMFAGPNMFNGGMSTVILQ